MFLTNKNNNYTRHIKSILTIGMLFMCFIVAAQPKQSVDSLKKTSKIYILGNEAGEYLQTDSVTVHKLLGNVKLLHGSDTLYCDSAFFYTNKNSVEAFGDVVIRQADGTEAYASYMRYTGNNRVVYMRSDNALADVKLFDGKTNSLYSREIDYNLGTKIGRYKIRGFLETATTTLESNTGQYNLRTKDARFKGDVVVEDPEYRARSTDLGYNTETKVVQFFGSSIVQNDKSTLQTSDGIYDSKNRTSHFVSRSSIINDAQYIEADTLDYNQNTGFGFAMGNVIAIDTALKTTLYCGYVQYNEIYGTLLAYNKPLMKKTNGADSLFIKADTFFSAPDTTASLKLSAQDSLQQTAKEIQSAIEKTDQNQDSAPSPSYLDSATIIRNPTTPSTLLNEQNKLEKDTVIADQTTNKKNDTHSIRNTITKAESDTITLATQNLEADSRYHFSRVDSTGKRNPALQRPDTSGPRYFIGYHNVLIYTDSLQGKCDSIRYAQIDSILRMYKAPLLWPRKSQLKGDMIYLHMDSSNLKEIHVPKNAIMITRSGPDKAGMYDQIQGNDIKCYLRNNKMDSLIAAPNASSIYFIKDDDGAYVGSSEATSDKIEVFFENESISKIYYRKDVEQKTTPMKEVTPTALHLSRFSWEEEKRPKTLEAFLEGSTLPHAPELLNSPHLE